MPFPSIVTLEAKQTGLRPKVAVLCLAGVLGGLAVIIALSGRTQLLNNAPLDKPPGFLVERARKIIGRMGYTDLPLDSWHGFVFADSWVKYVEQHDVSRARWEPLRTGERAVVGFVYRQSPRYLVSLNQFGVSFDDPPETVSGMVALILDSQGRLMLFVEVPPQIAEPGRSLEAPPDWSAVFDEAGLNRAEFHAVEPIRNPPSFVDLRAAWEGTMPGRNKIPVRVEAAAYRGKPVFFELIHADDACYRPVQSELPRHPKLRVLALAVSFLIAISLCLFLAYRTFKRGLSNYRGAFRLGSWVFLLTVLRSLLFHHHVGSSEEFRILATDVSLGIALAASAGLAYAVVEPRVQARSPRRLTSWTRFLGGGLGDPLVGSDMLIGCLSGVLLTFMQCLWNIAPGWLHRAPAFPSGGWASFAGLASPSERALLAADKALLAGTSLFVMFGLLGRLLRKEWIGVTAGWMLLTATFLLPSHDTLVDFFFAGVSAAVLTFCFVRFGLLSAVFLFFAYRMTYKELSITSHLAAWYARGTMVALGILVGLAIYGFYSSLRKPSLLPGPDGC
jgi:hypothetical protein